MITCPGICRAAIVAAWISSMIAVTAAPARAQSSASAATVPSPALISALRDRAAAGDPAARRALVPLLIAGHEASPTPQSLAETLYWTERAWGMLDTRELQQVARFANAYCGEPAIRWHWICQPGE